MIGSLSSDNINDSSKKTEGLDRQNNTLFVHFFAVFDYNTKMPNFTFCGKREHKATTFKLFFPWISIQFFRIELQKKSLTFDGLNEMEQVQ